MDVLQGTTVLPLPCVLSDEERQSRGRELGDTVSSFDDVMASKTASMKVFKDRLDGLQEKQRRLAAVIRDGVEDRLVKCEIRYHTPGEGLKRTIRLDTGEEVHEMRMNDQETKLHPYAQQAEFEAFMGKQSPEEAEPPLAANPPPLLDSAEPSADEPTE